MKLATLAIAITLALILQQSLSSIHPAALALRTLNDTWRTQNETSAAAPSNATTHALPDPANCDPPPTAPNMGTFFLANSTAQPHHRADAAKAPLVVSNFTEGRNSTHGLHTLNANVSDHSNSSYTEMHEDEGAVAPVDHEDAPLYEIASVHVHPVRGDSDEVLLSNEEGTVPPIHASTPVLHITDPRSVAQDSVQVMMINDDDVVLIDAELLNGATAPVTTSHAAADQSSVARESTSQVVELGKGGFLWLNEEQLAGSTPPPGEISIHMAAQSSVAREPVQVMVIDEDDVVFMNAEQLGRATPPPIDTPIHTAGQTSVARESMQVMEIKEQLTGSTPPPGDISIHTAAQSSVATMEPMQVMAIDEDDAISVTAEQLRRATPPPIEISIHTAGQRSVATESMQVMEIKEQLTGSTPPPGDDSIHTAAQSSVAKKPVQDMAIDEDDAVFLNAERLGHATPPPLDISIHTARQRSVAREFMQVIKIRKDRAAAFVHGEQLGASTPPPGNSDIHTASQSSVARDSSSHVPLQHEDSEHDHLMRL